MINVLGSAKRHWDISCPGDEELGDAAEKLVEWCIIKSEENLVLQNITPLEPSHNFTACVEGTIVGRVILYHDPETDTWYPELMPIDPYSAIYVSGRAGCRIVSIESTRPADEIYAQYEIPIKNNTAKVQDIWTVDQNIIKIDGNTVRTTAHSLGMNPVIVVPCPTTPFLTSQTDAAEYQAESIYAGVRDMYDVLNREATGWSTQNWMGFLPPVYGVLKAGRTLPKMEYGIGTQISLEDGESVQSWPIKDLSVAHQTFYGVIDADIQRGTMSNIEHGQLGFELSAVAIEQLTAKGDQHFVPRLMAKRNFMKQAAYALIKQFIIGGYPTDLKGLGEKITEWKPEQFKGKNFVIKVDYFAERPESDISNLTKAAAAQNVGLPPEYIYRNELGIEDVGEVMRMRAREIAIKLSPTAAALWCGEQLSNSPNELDKHIAEVLKMEAGIAEGNKAVTNPPSQPMPNMGVKMPDLMPKGNPQREELRRQGISKDGQTPPPGR
jgi:hypothetical protein